MPLDENIYFRISILNYTEEHTLYIPTLYTNTKKDTNT